MLLINNYFVIITCSSLRIILTWDDCWRKIIVCATELPNNLSIQGSWIKNLPLQLAYLLLLIINIIITHLMRGLTPPPRMFGLDTDHGSNIAADFLDVSTVLLHELRVRDLHSVILWTFLGGTQSHFTLWQDVRRLGSIIPGEDYMRDVSVHFDALLTFYSLILTFISSPLTLHSQTVGLLVKVNALLLKTIGRCTLMIISIL